MLMTGVPTKVNDVIFVSDLPSKNSVVVGGAVVVRLSGRNKTTSAHLL